MEFVPPDLEALKQANAAAAQQERVTEEVMQKAFGGVFDKPSTLSAEPWLKNIQEQLEIRGYDLIVAWALKNMSWAFTVQHPHFENDIQVYLNNSGGVFHGYALIIDKTRPKVVEISSNLRAPELHHIKRPQVMYAADHGYNPIFKDEDEQ